MRNSMKKIFFAIADSATFLHTFEFIPLAILHTISFCKLLNAKFVQLQI